MLSSVAKVFEELDEHLRRWIGKQRMFFVGTAPLGADGRVNVSPKGPIGTLRILGPRRVAYLDYSGSGAETVAHLRENGRIVVMFCAFEGPPKIVRLHGTGEVVFPDDASAKRGLSADSVRRTRFDELLEACAFDELTEVAEGRRAIIVVDVERISDSCGYGVPLMQFESHRSTMSEWSERKGRDGILVYQAEKNVESIDGLPAVPAPQDAGAISPPGAAP